jgi:hypothetical protein
MDVQRRIFNLAPLLHRESGEPRQAVSEHKRPVSVNGGWKHGSSRGRAR